MSPLREKLESAWYRRFGDQYREDQRSSRDLMSSDGNLCFTVNHSTKLEEWYRSPAGIARYEKPDCFMCSRHDEYETREAIAEYRHLVIVFNMKFVTPCHFLIFPKEHRDTITAKDIIALKDFAAETGLVVFGNLRNSGASYPSHVHFQCLDANFPVTNLPVIQTAGYRGNYIDIEQVQYPTLAFKLEAVTSENMEAVAKAIESLDIPFNPIFWGDEYQSFGGGNVWIIPRSKSVPSNTNGFKFAAAESAGQIYTRHRDLFESLTYEQVENAIKEVGVDRDSNQARLILSQLILSLQKSGYNIRAHNTTGVLYRVRKEKNGAISFNTRTHTLEPLTTEAYATLQDTNGHDCRVEPGSSLSDRGYWIPYSCDLDNFILIDPYAILGKDSPTDCLSAPNRIYLEVTHRCNLRCVMCYNAAGKPKLAEMTTAEIFRLLEEMNRIGVMESRFTGGEPTCREDILDLLDRAINLDFYVSLATNGVWRPELVDAISNRKLDDVIISLEGPQEINDRIRGTGAFETTLNTIKALKAAGIPKVRINTTLTKLNYKEVEPLFKIVDDLGLLLVDFIHPRPFGRGASAHSRELMLTAKETLDFNLLVQRLRQKYPNVNAVMDFDLFTEKDVPRHPIVPRIHACPAGREFAFISPQGNVFPCGVAPVHEMSKITDEERNLFVAGNVNEQSLLEIWHNSPVWLPYRDLRQCKPEKCFACSYWGKKCYGTCPIGAYYATGRLDGEDPYCYKDCFKK